MLSTHNLDSPLWHTVSDTIGQRLGNTFMPQSLESVHGGDISQAFILSGPLGRYFIKLNERRNLAIFTAEHHTLEALQPYAPRAIAVGEFEQWAYIVMNCLDIRPHGDDFALGALVATLHIDHTHRHQGQPRYGWETDNFIGTTPQTNTWCDNWGEFWVENRLRPQLDLALKQGYLREQTTLIEEFLQANHKILADHHPPSALLHGDLWRGNAGFDGETPVIYDPASYYGDRETDLALTELFGGFSTEFYRGYDHTYPLDSGYYQRKHLYNSYHLLNHLNLFGGGYLGQVVSVMNRVVAN